MDGVTTPKEPPPAFEAVLRRLPKLEVDVEIRFPAAPDLFRRSARIATPMIAMITAIKLFMRSRMSEPECL